MGGGARRGTGDVSGTGALQDSAMDGTWGVGTREESAMTPWTLA